MTIMDGKAVAQNWKQDMSRMLLMCKVQPCLAVISVGEDSIANGLAQRGIPQGVHAAAPLPKFFQYRATLFFTLLLPFLR